MCWLRIDEGAGHVFDFSNGMHITVYTVATDGDLHDDRQDTSDSYHREHKEDRGTYDVGGVGRLELAQACEADESYLLEVSVTA